MTEENKDLNTNEEVETVDQEDLKKERIKKAKEAIEEIVDGAKDIAEEIIDGVGDTLDVVQDVAEDFKDKYFKVLAEMENLRKRFDAERTEVMKYRASSFIQNILPTVDMFQMAMKAQNASDEVKNWLIGFEMILNNFISALEGEGVKEIVVNKGDDFDANFHHAIEEIETEEVEPGKIVEVKMKGYTLHDKLLRPATVTVAKQQNKQEENLEENKEQENIEGENNE